MDPPGGEGRSGRRGGEGVRAAARPRRPPPRPGPAARPRPYSQHDPRDVQPHRDAPVFEGGGDEAAEGERRHHAQREGEQRVRPRQHRVHRGRRPETRSPRTPGTPFRPRSTYLRAAPPAPSVPGWGEWGALPRPRLLSGPRTRASARAPAAWTHPPAGGTRRTGEPEPRGGPPLLARPGAATNQRPAREGRGFAAEGPPPGRWLPVVRPAARPPSFPRPYGRCSGAAAFWVLRFRRFAL